MHGFIAYITLKVGKQYRNSIHGNSRNYFQLFLVTIIKKWWEVSVGSNTSASERSTSSNTGFDDINNAASTIQPYQYQPLIQGHAVAGASSNAQEEEEEEEEGTFVPDLAYFFGPMLR